jgi:hypothetical protein
MVRHSRRMRRTRKGRKQQGGGWSYNGPAFQPAVGMAPEAARAAIDTGCDAPARPAPQLGGGCGCMAAPPMRGGGSGTGGYGFVLDNSMGGKVYADLTRGPCPSQSGGSLRSEPVVSYPSGYGYNTASAVEVGGGTAHFLEQVPYGRQCMGGGARKRSGRNRHASRKHSGRKRSVRRRYKKSRSQRR